MSRRMPKMIYADSTGNIFDHPELCMAGINGRRMSS